ncbi:FAD-binding oxidoreductase [Stappia sp. F7233]|uniref:FAD-binding oxidoreductase n=1 Tax=Stappia albiluteola TaxID=2758565 RepID=A0A839AD31_9HYPH|nr:FAD-binding oxidoreductase [Stappia albiluteola]MBA5777670.1 FAD-binding oxidoreductase [Stappia albiluteola]
MRKVDVIILGAGIVGVTTAIRLRMAGADVVVVDKGRPGDEASRAGAGVIEASSLVPLSAPEGMGAFLRLALNLDPSYRYKVAGLPALLPWLSRLRASSDRAHAMRYAGAVHALYRVAAADTRDLLRRASAERFFRPTGVLRIYRSEEGIRRAELDLHYARIFGVRYEMLDIDGAGALEPHLNRRFSHAVYLPDNGFVSSPGGVTKAFARHLREIGGAVEEGDALDIRHIAGGWVVRTEKGEVFAKDAVVALGAWSGEVLKPFGYRYPLIAPRGYYQHFRPNSGASLSRPVEDVENGYTLSPMERGIRLTTGCEFAPAGAPFDPSQLAQALRTARKLFPIDRPTEKEIWAAPRPLLPDSLPVVGRSPRHKGLWVNFGHGSHGFTLAPATARLLAEMMADGETFTDPAPLSPLRFGL